MAEGSDDVGGRGGGGGACCGREAAPVTLRRRSLCCLVLGMHAVEVVWGKGRVSGWLRKAGQMREQATLLS